ncbi:MAG: hypothetical protein ACT6FE_01035 [Methanosarcinaceae archaeon]
MLGKLFSSKLRVKILKLFLMHCEKKYYVRQLAHKLEFQINSVRRELKNLEQFGLLNSFNSNKEYAKSEECLKNEVKMLMSGKVVTRVKSKKIKLATKSQEKKFYQVNKNFILFEEIKALIIKSHLFHEKDFTDQVKKIGIVKLLIFSGFFVNADYSVDILIVGRLNKSKLIKLIKNLEKEICRELTFTLMNYNEFKYRRDIADVFLYGILDGKKLVLIDEEHIS